MFENIDKGCGIFIMQIEEVSQEKYDLIVKDDRYVYSSSRFNELNSYKVETVKYLLFKNSKYRFGLIIGIKEGEVLCPFSAPFSSIVPIKDVKIQYYDEAVDALISYAVGNKYRGIRIILPPFFYNETEISYFVNTLYRKNFIIQNMDLNYQFHLNREFVDNYGDHLPSDKKRELVISLESDLLFQRCENKVEMERAYSVLAENKRQKGYPMKMTYKQVLDTSEIVDCDFFLVSRREDDIAAGLVHHINDKVAQIVYWGHISGFSECKPMSFLAYNLIEYYAERGFDYLDVGPSTEDSVPNYGLCNFKQGVGCKTNLKLTLKWEYDRVE